MVVVKVGGLYAETHHIKPNIKPTHHDTITIYDALELAIKNNSKIQSANQRVIASHHDRDITLARFLPQIKTIGNAGSIRKSKKSTNVRGRSYSYGVEFQQHIYDFGKKQHHLAISMKEQDKNIAEHIQTKNDILYEVAKNFIATLQAQQTLELRKIYYKSLEKDLENKIIELKEGRIVSHDVNILRASLMQAKAKELQSKADVTVQRQNLFKYLDVSSQELSIDELKSFFEHKPFIDHEHKETYQFWGKSIYLDPKKLYDVALEQSAIIKKHYADYEQHMLQKKLEQKRFFPTITTIVKSDIGKTGSVNTNSTTLLFQLESPLYEGGKREASMNKYIANMKAIQYMIDEETRYVQSDVNNALTSYEASFHSLVETQQSLDEWSMIITKLSQSLQEGLIKPSDVQQYQQDYIELQIRYHVLKFDLLQHLLLLYKKATLLEHIMLRKDMSSIYKY